MTQDVFPPANLSGLSTPWARAHDVRLIAAENKIDILEQGISGQNRNTASSLASLGAQILDLSGRVSYSLLDPTVGDMWISSQPEQNWGPTLTFELDRTRVVSLSFTVSATAIASAGSPDTVSDVWARTSFAVDGNPVSPVASGETYVYASTTPSSVGGNSNESRSSLTARGLIVLSEGVHTLQGVIRPIQMRIVGPTGAYGVHSLSVQNPALFVDVLQPA